MHSSSSSSSHSCLHGNNHHSSRSNRSNRSNNRNNRKVVVRAMWKVARWPLRTTWQNDGDAPWRVIEPGTTFIIQGGNNNKTNIFLALSLSIACKKQQVSF